MDSTFKQQFIDRIDDRIRNIADGILAGAMDQDEYRNQAGIIRGLKESKDYFEEIYVRFYGEEEYLS